MALPSTIYRASLALADTDREVYAQLPLTIAQHPSETSERLLARLLAYALCYEEGLVFTRGIASGSEPDLWSKDPDGRIRLWLEVGLPEAERLLKASRHAARVILLACGTGRPRWEFAHLAKLTAIPNLTVIALEQPFLQQLAGHLQRSLSWSLTVSGGRLYLSVGGSTLESAIELLAGPALSAPAMDIPL
jgi:uncharacterized protein YaeQ